MDGVKRALVDVLWEDNDTNEAIRYAAGRVSKRYRGYITFEDLRQSGYIWLFQHPHKVASELPSDELEEKERRYQFRRLVRLFERALEGVGRSEKAAAEGYKVDDECFYDAALLEELLPTVFDDNAAGNPPQREEGTRSNSDPAEGGTWIVMVADMQRAWKLAELSVEERSLVAMRYGEGLILEECANALSMTKETALKRLRRAKNELARTLHGVRPLYLPTEEEQ